MELEPLTLGNDREQLIKEMEENNTLAPYRALTYRRKKGYRWDNVK